MLFGNKTKRLGFAIAAAAFVGVLIAWNYHRPIFAPNPTSYTKIGTPLVDQLQAYKQFNGRYPISLNHGGIQNITTRHGTFSYRCLSSGSECELSIGNYARYQFEVHWNSETGWYVDT